MISKRFGLFLLLTLSFSNYSFADDEVRLEAYTADRIALLSKQELIEEISKNETLVDEMQEMLDSGYRHTESDKTFYRIARGIRFASGIASVTSFVAIGGAVVALGGAGVLMKTSLGEYFGLPILLSGWGSVKTIELAAEIIGYSLVVYFTTWIVSKTGEQDLELSEEEKVRVQKNLDYMKTRLYVMKSRLQVISN
ncbi:MAG: hypothetical protein AB7F43_01140 [Bacteriovoracia bacterium]